MATRAQVRFTEEINRAINQAIAGGLPFATVASVLSTQSTAVTAAASTRDRTIKDPGPALNPRQPRTGT